MVQFRQKDLILILVRFCMNHLYSVMSVHGHVSLLATQFNSSSYPSLNEKEMCSVYTKQHHSCKPCNIDRLQFKTPLFSTTVLDTFFLFDATIKK